MTQFSLARSQVVLGTGEEGEREKRERKERKERRERRKERERGMGQHGKGPEVRPAYQRTRKER